MFPNKTNVRVFVAVVGVFSFAPLQVWGDVTLTVPAEAVVYFAGQSQPSLQTTFPPTPGWETEPWDVGATGDVTNFFGDSAPWEGVVRAEVNAGEEEGFTIEDRTAASTIPPFVNVVGLTTVSLTASGNWGRGPLMPHGGPDGIGSGTTHEVYDDLGVSRVLNCPLDSLVGVFLGNGVPDPKATPDPLTCGGFDMTTPELQQAFYIGSNLTEVTVPAGATRLFVGFNDSGAQWNNDGDVVVTVLTGTPIPTVSEWGLIVMSLLVLTAGTLVYARRRPVRA